MKFFMADPHFGHLGIILMMARINPNGEVFKSVEEHDCFLLDEINRKVGRDDELIILGDFSWEKPGKYRQKIRCKNIKLILGNHDQTAKCVNVFGAGNVFQQYATKIHLGDTNNYLNVFCSHYPHAFWEGSHNGWSHLYGHTHGQREDFLDLMLLDRRSLDVGVDNIHRLFGHYGPLTEEDVYHYMARRTGHDDLEPYHEYQAELYLSRGLDPPYFKPKSLDNS